MSEEPKRPRDMSPEELVIYKRDYMREYKRRRYKANPATILSCNRKSYYKRQYRGTSEEVKLYGEAFPLYSKITAQLEELKQAYPDVIPEVLLDILNKYGEPEVEE